MGQAVVNPHCEEWETFLPVNLAIGVETLGVIGIDDDYLATVFFDFSAGKDMVWPPYL